MLKTVTFDWWFTIAQPPMSLSDYSIWAKNIRVDGLHRVLNEIGRDVPRAAIDNAYDLFSRHIEDVWRRNVDLSAEQQIAILLQYAKMREVDDPDIIKRLQEPFGRVFLEHPVKLSDGIGECLSALKKEGYLIGLISNTGRTWGRFLRDIQKLHGIFDYFDVLTFSDEVGLRKPNALIFQKTLQKLGAEPGTAVHIGDDVQADIDGARGVGMKAIWYNTGVWPDAVCDYADAEISSYAELPAILKRL